MLRATQVKSHLLGNAFMQLINALIVNEALNTLNFRDESFQVEIHYNPAEGMYIATAEIEEVPPQ